MKALKIIGFVVIGILGLAFAFVLVQPSKGHVEKSIVINAPASAIFPHSEEFYRLVTLEQDGPRSQADF